MTLDAIPRPTMARLKWAVLWVEIFLISFLAVGMVVGVAAFNDVQGMIPPEETIRQYSVPQGTQIFSSDGVLLAKLASEHREPIEFDKIPETMRDAVVAIEDARFYDHHGVDLRGIARSVVANLQSGDLTGQGASTITQQLARTIYLSRKKTFTRKAREALMAIQIERNWTKAKILETFLNQVYFGSGAYGVQAAAKVYFDKDISDLTLAETALIAGLPQRPSIISPYLVREKDQEMKACIARRNAVLDAMAAQGYVDRAKAEAAKTEKIRLAHDKAPRLGGYFKAKHFVDYVVQELQRVYGEDMVLKGGLQVSTSLNWKMQEAAEAACESNLKRFGRTYGVGEVALVCIDPHTGYIRAMVGGASKPWEQQQFNCAVQAKRQPGSSFKLFVYAAALEEGWSVNRGIPSAMRPYHDGDKLWVVRNHSRVGGSLPMTSAFALSVNTCAANTILEVGPQKVVDVAHRMGIQSDLMAVPALALGSSEVTVLEMATAYGTIPANGKRARPIAIRQVADSDGNVLEQQRPTLTETQLGEDTLDGLKRLTRAVVTRGTGTVVSRVPEAHGKTGTTNDYRDAWFVGFTPELATAVWGGNLDNHSMRRGYGGTIAAPIWRDFMVKAVELNPENPKPKPARKADPPPKPAADPEPDEDVQEERPPRVTAEQARTILGADGGDSNLIRVRICSDTGEVATSFCPNTSEDVYYSGAQPTTRCSLHTGPPASAPPRAREPRPSGDSIQPRIAPAPPERGDENTF